MALKTYEFPDGVLRLYDGTGTPYYLEVPFVEGKLVAPEGRARPAEIAVINRGRVRQTDTLWHYVEGPDTPIIEPLTLTFSFKMANTEPNYQKLRDALNIDMTATWTVGSNTWVTTKGLSQVLSGGESPQNVTTPAFSDPRKRCVDIQALWSDPDGTSDIGRRFREVYFEPSDQQFNEQDVMLEVRLTGRIYGSITDITAFTAGTAG